MTDQQSPAAPTPLERTHVEERRTWQSDRDGSTVDAVVVNGVVQITVDALEELLAAAGFTRVVGREGRVQ